MKGMYVALEGVEGSGKSTVSNALMDVLAAHGIESMHVREPGGTWLGEEIRRLLLHEDDMTPWAEAALFAAQRAQLAAEVISPALGRGVWVISDRSYFSSLAYQGAARGLGVEHVKALNLAVLDGVVPDLVAVIDIDPEIGLARQTDADRIGSAGLEFQQRVAAAYRMLADEDPERVRLVTGSGTPADIADRIVAIARSLR